MGTVDCEPDCSYVEVDVEADILVFWVYIVAGREKRGKEAKERKVQHPTPPRVCLHFVISTFNDQKAPHSMRRARRQRAAAAPQVQVLQPSEDAPPLKITMLGAGQEVGRSCCVIEHRGKKVVCDTGLHPAYPGMGSLPFIDELDWSTVDAILVTQ